ncbi:uncharacterized protein CCOS01_08325 [Colletotrichum costaricense]|uniref:Fungal STAND N-terminal Goodbye domain-containing protein n=1 Tax=Colletotrichum costaricense TaxID=1209916 RepID=A0AAI9YVM2_9PEZI|nr:uncharacterized protein CCOS01_08325 [Colletotrichum costaricense]KAK1525907.1 hypothetical protein CCOS01_08325 [Colletotrichum costaricense]
MDVTNTSSIETEEYRRWIKHHASSQDPAWAFDDAVKRLQMPPASRKLEASKLKFDEYIKGFLLRSSDSATKNILGNTASWEDVLVEAKAVCDRYKTQRNIFGYKNRLFTTSARRIEFLIELVPSGDYTGTICGGLKLICSAAKRHHELVDVVLNALATLSQEIDATKTYVRLYAWSPLLRSAVETLYVAVLVAIEAMIKWLEGLMKDFGGFRAGLRSIFAGENYGSELRDKITTSIDEASAHFDDAVRECFHLKFDGVAENILTLGNSLEEVHQFQGDESNRRAEEAKRQEIGLQKSFEAMKSLENVVHGLARDSKWQMEEIKALRAEINQQCQGKPQQVTNHYHLSIPQVTASQLLSALGFGLLSNAETQAVSAIQRDSEFVVFMGKSLNPQNQGRITSVTQDFRFQHWFKSMNSEVLTISGMELDALHTDLVSPLSYMCSILARTLSRINCARPLAFFCRLHCDPDGPLPGSTGLLRSLISQIVLSSSDQIDLGFLAETDLQTIRSYDLEVLWGVFENVVNQLRSGVIFCMIDGVTFLQSELHIRGMYLVMQWLGMLVKDIQARNSGLVFKVMATSPVGSEYFRVWFPDAIEIALPGSFLSDGLELDEHRMTSFAQGSFSSA